MLRYFAHGRVQSKSGMRCNTRTNWEFYAVLEGRCGLRFSDEEPPTLHERTLWVFAPECAHAWVDDTGRDYERLSLHFGSVPYPLDELVRQHGGWLSHALTGPDIRWLAGIARELAPVFHQPTVVGPLLSQRALVELALLLLQGHEEMGRDARLPNFADGRTERAIAWYMEHLAQNPTVKEVAAAVHISPSHLRRLFWQSRHASPKTVFRRLRLDHAKELMSRSTGTLDDVAAHAGYASASHLCRDCRAVDRFSPTTWRKRIVHRFVQPEPALAAPAGVPVSAGPS